MKNYIGTATMLLVTMGAALGCYTLSLKVSGERQAAAKLRTQIAADTHDIGNLKLELRTRARMPELQRWNDNVWKMSAPSAAQYLHSPVELASFIAPRSGASGAAQVQLTVAGPAAPAVPASAPNGLVRAAYHVATTVDLGAGNADSGAPAGGR